MQQRFDQDKAIAEESIRTRLESEYLKRERDVTEAIRKDRDRQLEAAIQRVEEEGLKFRDEAENSAQEKIK